MADVVTKSWNLTSFNGRRYSTNEDPNASSPALGHVGYDFDDDTATASRFVIDLRMPTATYADKIWLTGYGPPGQLDRASTATYQPGGGYYEQGCLRIVSGAASGNEENDPGHEMMCGIGQLYGLNAVAPGGACTKLTIGFLFTPGTSYWPLGAQGKQIIVVRQDAVRRDNGAPRSTRPMIILQGDSHKALGACDGTVCNYTTEADGDDFFNGSGVGPNQSSLGGVSQWVQFEIDLDEPYDEIEDEPIGECRVKVYSADGTYQGTPILRNDLMEDVGGTLPAIDTVMGWAATVQDIDGNFYYDLEYIEVWVGESSGMTPPVGFPGSAR